MNHSKMVTVLAISLFSLALTACGKNRGKHSNQPPPPGVVQPSELINVQSASLEIIDGRTFKAIEADRNDNPESYAIQSELVRPREAFRRLTLGETLCMTRIQGMRVRSSEYFDHVRVRQATNPDAGNLHYVTFAHREKRQGGLSVVCMKTNSPLSLNDVNAALDGIATLTIQ